MLSKIPEMHPAVRSRREEIDRLKEQIDDLESKARLEDLDVWKMEKVKGAKVYTYWLVSWRESDKVHNVHLGSCRKMSRPEALKKAKKLKAEALGISI
ncbi:MAG: hypothetical protein MUO26_06520 [Methanotrichaceae archaeon]|nr:hypothetical protein [Methanotrichaceae archaeon]